jgi:DNA-binding transcriptional LysR family regulator
MNRNHLALFNRVARAGGISRGAADARISQPAVSKQIAELEDFLGVRLLERLPRGCRLTEAGVILAGYAQRCECLEKDALRAMEEYRGLKRGRLAIGASLTIGAYLMPKILAAFGRRFPDIELRLEIANTRHIEEALRQGAIQLGLTEGAIVSKDLESAVFYEDELVAIAPAAHPLLNRPPVSLRELCREPFIMREEGSGTRAVVERALRRKGVTITPRFALASPEAIKNSVALGMGLAIVSRLIIDLELRMGLLKILPVKDLMIPRPLHLQQLRGQTPSPSQIKFQEVLAEQANPAPHGKRHL